MITVSIKGLLIGALLIALIVLVVYLIILISNVTDTIKKTNAIIDGGTEAADFAITKAAEIGNSARDSAAKVNSMAGIGVELAQGIVNRLISR